MSKSIDTQVKEAREHLSDLIGKLHTSVNELNRLNIYNKKIRKKKRKSITKKIMRLTGEISFYDTQLMDHALLMENPEERCKRGSVGPSIFMPEGELYIDPCNSHSSFMDKVEMSNLCQEITLPTKPLNHIEFPEENK